MRIFTTQTHVFSRHPGSVRERSVRNCSAREVSVPVVSPPVVSGREVLGREGAGGEISPHTASALEGSARHTSTTGASGVLPPRINYLDPAELSAAKITGELVPCGLGYKQLGSPETPYVRRVALATLIPKTFCAADITAAWVWGASESLGNPMQAFYRGTSRLHLTPQQQGNIRFVEYTPVRLEPGDLTVFDELPVTNPSRTLYDLLRSPEQFQGLRLETCARLIEQFSLSLTEIEHRLFCEYAGMEEFLKSRLNCLRDTLHTRSNTRARARTNSHPAVQMLSQSPTRSAFPSLS